MHRVHDSWSMNPWDYIKPGLLVDGWVAQIRTSEGVPYHQIRTVDLALDRWGRLTSQGRCAMATAAAHRRGVKSAFRWISSNTPCSYMAVRDRELTKGVSERCRGPGGGARWWGGGFMLWRGGQRAQRVGQHREGVKRVRWLLKMTRVAAVHRGGKVWWRLGFEVRLYENIGRGNSFYTRFFPTTCDKHGLSFYTFSIRIWSRLVEDKK
jgi:hypothetical protein